MRSIRSYVKTFPDFEGMHNAYQRFSQWNLYFIYLNSQKKKQALLLCIIHKYYKSIKKSTTRKDLNILLSRSTNIAEQLLINAKNYFRDASDSEFQIHCFQVHFQGLLYKQVRSLHNITEQLRPSNTESSEQEFQFHYQ